MIDKKEIYNYFSNNKKAININELIKKFKITSDNLDSFLEILVELEKEGKILLDEYQNYIPVSTDSCLKQGEVKISNRGKYYLDFGKGKRITIKDINKKLIKNGDSIFVVTDSSSKKKKHKNYQEGTVYRKIEKPSFSLGGSMLKVEIKREYESRRCFVLINEKKYYISSKYLNSAYPGDIVTVFFEETEKKSIVKVVDIIERKNRDHVFECVEVNGKKEWVPVETVPFPIKTKPHNNVAIGTRVLATILDNDNEHKLLIQKELKADNQLELAIESLLLEHHFHYGFSNEVKKEVAELKAPDMLEEITKRRDLRNLETFTIDSAHAKDLDDAISLEKVGDHYKLYVHIADVSHYVKPGMKIFNEALYRGVSVYPADFVEPMLDKKLSNQLCSLNPNEDKLTKTCMIELDSEGKIINYDVFKSIIRSNYKMSYSKVDDLLEKRERDPDYLPYSNTLNEMYRLAKMLQEQRMSKGVLALNDTELKFDVDDLGKPISLNERQKGPSHMIIENFMILANYAVTDYAFWLNIPFVYRNHEVPSAMKIRSLEEHLLNISNFIRKITNINNPKVLQNLFLSLTKDKSEEEVKHISDIFLRSMMKAYYSKTNIGHFGLALEHYGTFTSPIRKANDLLNHLFLDEVLEYGMHNPVLDPIKEELDKICEHLSIRQYESEQVEKDVNLKLFHEYASQFTDHTLNARITFLSDDGIFVKTDENIPGHIPISRRYCFYKLSRSLYDEKLKKIYHVGDKIEVKMKASSRKSFSIEFEICSEKSIGEETNKILVKK